MRVKCVLAFSEEKEYILAAIFLTIIPSQDVFSKSSEMEKFRLIEKPGVVVLRTWVEKQETTNE